jgi:anti-sigma factor RsiW
MNEENMNCRRVSRLLEDYLLEELVPEKRDIVESHLSVCRSCAEKAERLEKILNLYTATMEISPGEQVLEDTLKMLPERALTEHNRREFPRRSHPSGTRRVHYDRCRRWVRYPVPMYTFAAGILLAFAAGFLLFTGLSKTPDPRKRGSDRFSMGLQEGKLTIQVDLDDLTFIPAGSYETHPDVLTGAGMNFQLKDIRERHSAGDTL